jgi:hypothetical protein
MSDLIERLRAHATSLRWFGGFAEAHLPEDAADEIERLKSELAEARKERDKALEEKHEWVANNVEKVGQLIRLERELGALRAELAEAKGSIKLANELRWKAEQELQEALKAQPAQSEPFGWLLNENFYRVQQHALFDDSILPGQIPLYTTPQPSADVEHIIEKVNQAIPYINASTHGGAKAIRILEAAIAMKKDNYEHSTRYVRSTSCYA